MAKIYEGVGDFGRLLASAVNADGRPLDEIGDELLISGRTIYNHIRHRSRPAVTMIEIYSNYMNVPSEKLRYMSDKDWDVEAPEGEFARNLRDIMYRHNLTVDDLSNKLGFSTKTIYKWLKGANPSTRSFIKLMRFVCNLEGLL